MMSTIGTTKTSSFVEIREVTLQFLGDLTWNDLYYLFDYSIWVTALLVCLDLEFDSNLSVKYVHATLKISLFKTNEM